MPHITYVMIPGAGGAAWYWHRVEAELHARGHDAVSVDIPTDDDTAGLEAYADTVMGAIGQRDGELVLVAQSMGAYTAALVCERVPVALLVLVNPMIPLPGETAGEWWEATGHDEAIRESDRREGRPGDGRFDDELHFLHDLPPDVRSGLGAHVRKQSGRPFADAIGAWPDIPVRMITGRDDRFFPAAFQRRIARERLGIVPEELPGGHLVALVHPAKVADLLETYRAETAAAA
jgi:pimeloyl-ACP methyl ester carboxylesterase